MASSSKSINAIDEVPNANEFPFYSLKNHEMKVRIMVWANFAQFPDGNSEASFLVPEPSNNRNETAS